MFRKNIYRAFSLIEISIIVLIISLLISGILRSNTLLTSMKLNSAANLTKSSPVGSINGLVLWLESTTIDSFKESEIFDIEDSTQITTWRDINPQSSKKYYALTAATSAITYQEISEINDLPSIYFDGSVSTDRLTLSKSSSISEAIPIITPDNDFTFFVVSKLDSDADSSVTAFSNGNTAGWGYEMNGASPSRYRRVAYPGVGDIDTSAANGSNNPEIVTVTYSGNTGQATTMRVNGESIGISSTAIDSDIPNTALYIGNASSGSPWKGYISEIIIYKKVLNAERISKVEKYLSQKYKIYLN